VRKIRGKYPEFVRGCILQRNGDTIGMYHFAYVCRNGAQDLSQVEARGDFARQIEEQLKPIVLSSYFLFCAHA
jgi:hypothetical protein